MKSDIDRDAAPSTNIVQMTAAAVMLMIPIVALLWVDTYAKADPELLGFPFFIWYQFLWVFLCSACTAIAYRLVQAARPRRPLPAARREQKRVTR